MKICVTGGCGFIGANLVQKLIEHGHDVSIIDNLSTGSFKFLEFSRRVQPNVHQIDLSRCSEKLLESIFSDCNLVFHLAANADVRGGFSSTFRDIENNVIATHNVAVAASKAGVPEIVFASTGCVYGDPQLVPTSENEPFPVQTSLYGASKVAAEGILSTFAGNGNFRVTTFRFVSVLGRYYHHGHVVDFVRQLLENPNELKVLGDGSQRKSYVSVSDCVEALINLRGTTSYEVFNIGNDAYFTVKDSAKLICKSLGLNPLIRFGDGNRGWIGDNPFSYLDISKAKLYGWQPRVSIEKSVVDTVKWIVENKWVLSQDTAR